MATERNNADSTDARVTAEDVADCQRGQSQAELGPFLVTPKQAGELLGVGKTTVFDLLSKNVLERRRINGATRVTMRSIRKVAGV